MNMAAYCHPTEPADDTNPSGSEEDEKSIGALVGRVIGEEGETLRPTRINVETRCISKTIPYLY